MIYQIFSLFLSALFLMFMFLALWYVALPLLAVAVLLSAFGRLRQNWKIKKRFRNRHRPIKANDVIDVDFKEVK